jgi:hypothetical protein
MIPRWARLWLLAAGIYNLVWGAAVVLFPRGLFELAGLDEWTTSPGLVPIWQCLGMVIGVYGIGYLAASIDPFRHWPIVLVGLLGKIFGPIGFVWCASRGEIPWHFGVTILTNDLLWWIPFFLILRGAWRTHRDEDDRSPAQPLDEALRSARTQRGQTLETRSQETRLLVVCVRHFGCTLCRAELAELARRRSAIEATGAAIVVVHSSDPETAERFLAARGLAGIDHVADPDRLLYRALGLGRGTFLALLGPRAWLRGGVEFLRHGIGYPEGDPLQMPGSFLVHRGRVERAVRPASVADATDYCTLAAP